MANKGEEKKNINNPSIRDKIAKCFILYNSFNSKGWLKNIQQSTILLQTSKEELRGAKKILKIDA